MKNTLALLTVAGIAAAAQADGLVIAYTSFENAFVGDRYVDTGDASVDHDLINNAGQSVVDFLDDGVEIGFDSEYFNSRNSVGLTDGDFVGATDFTGTVGAFTDGVQGFEMSDPDGTMRTNFDTVTSPLGTPGARVEFEWSLCMDFYVQDTGWESDDRIRIWVDADGTELDILNTAGSDINDLGITGGWNDVEFNLTGYANITLHVELESNSGSEALYLDNIVFKTGVPAPGSLALLGLGGLAATRRRR
ncbi:MAG: PEP-CTERM sorting domain-containing protein [Phycisphaerales bacterium]